MLIVLFGLLAAPRAASPTTPDGSYALVSDPAQVQADIDASIEEAIAPANIAMRAIYRLKLSDTMRFCDRYEFQQEPAALALQCDEGPRRVFPYDNSGESFLSADGKQVTARIAVKGATTVLVFQSEGGGGQTVVYQPQGEELLVTKTLTHPMLPESLSWKMRYQRQ